MQNTCIHTYTCAHTHTVYTVSTLHWLSFLFVWYKPVIVRCLVCWMDGWFKYRDLTLDILSLSFIWSLYSEWWFPEHRRFSIEFAFKSKTRLTLCPGNQSWRFYYSDQCLGREWNKWTQVVTVLQAMDFTGLQHTCHWLSELFVIDSL